MKSLIACLVVGLFLLNSTLIAAPKPKSGEAPSRQQEASSPPSGFEASVCRFFGPKRAFAGQFFQDERGIIAEIKKGRPAWVAGKTGPGIATYLHCYAGLSVTVSKNQNSTPVPRYWIDYSRFGSSRLSYEAEGFGCDAIFTLPGAIVDDLILLAVRNDDLAVGHSVEEVIAAQNDPQYGAVYRSGRCTQR